MRIEHGLLCGQVLQRSRFGKGGALIRGKCRADGNVELRVMKAGRVVPGHNWKMVGAAKAKSFEAELRGLRVGGPYRVELRITGGGRAESIAVDEIFVGDVWILGGQSNMEGIGNMVHAPKPHSMVRAFYMRDEWGIAQEKLHYLCEAVDKVHNSYGDEPGRPPKEELEKGRANLFKGVSPGHMFGLEMYRRTRVPQGLIPCAHGGTSMDQWSPALRCKGGESLYGAMMRRFEKLGQPVAGVLWYQGESDANPVDAPVYTEKMIRLVSSTRRDMGLPKLPWLIVQLGCHAARDNEAAWNSIQEQQRLLPDLIDNLDVAPAIDLELDDGIHISGSGQKILGRRLARLADRLVHKASGVKGGMRLKGMALVTNPDCNVGDASKSIEISYSNVAGNLTSHGRPAGFTLMNDAGQEVGGIYKMTLKGSKVQLHTNYPAVQLQMFRVSYGPGKHPVCNITDSEGMSLPVMHGVRVVTDHARYCNNWRTAYLPGVKSVEKVGFAKAVKARGWRPAPPRNGFGVLPQPVTSKRIGVFVLRTELEADETLEAQLVFGANGPFKMWLNGSLVLQDLQCGIPLNPDQYRKELKLKKGRNDLTVCFAPLRVAPFFGICARVGTMEDKVEKRVRV